MASWPPQPWTWTSTKPGIDERAARCGGIRLHGGDALPLDDQPSRLDPVRQHQPTLRRRSTPSSRHHPWARACSAPWTAAPMAPAPVPSSAIDERDALQVGHPRPGAGPPPGWAPASSSPAAATPPPSTTRSGVSAVTIDRECRCPGTARSRRSPRWPRASPAAAAATASSARGRAAQPGDLLRLGERLEAAAVAAVAERPVRRRSSCGPAPRPCRVAHGAAARRRTRRPHARAQREADHRAGAATGAQAQLREPERARVVDERHRQARRRADGSGDRDARPVARHVGQEHGRALRGQ